MKRDVAITFVEGVPGAVKGAVIKRFLSVLSNLDQGAATDTSSIPRLFGTDADSDILAEAYERLPDEDRAMIERVQIFEDAA